MIACPAARACRVVALLATLAGCAADDPAGAASDGGDAGARVDARRDTGVGPARDTGARDAPADTRQNTAAVVTGDCAGDAGAARAECVCASRTETPCYPGPAAQVNVGPCRPGRARCEATGEFGRWAVCAGAVLPTPEACDGLDNDCDGAVDDGCACRPGTSRGCYLGPAGTAGVGRCRAGTQPCVAGAAGVGAAWGACTGDVRPAAETCNGADDDCDGMVDEGAGCACRGGTTRACYTGPAGTEGRGACRGGTQTCDPSGTRWGACAGERLPSPEVCNSIDDDCDGAVDEVPECRGPVATCPMSVTAPAGTPVPVSVSVSPGVSCRWEVVTRPPGAGAEGTFANPMACSTTFTSVIVGTYVLRVTVSDAMGRSGVCGPAVTLTGRGLRVELAWSTPGDVDLHLLHAAATAWFSRPHDCYFANTRPTWDGGGGQSPGLDVDNVTAYGPENIRVDAPVVGQTYRIGVHAYGRVASGSEATVRVYCGDATTPSRAFTRTVRTGATSGDNDFWRVADVRIDAPGRCTITELGTVVTSTAAHAGR